MSETVTAPPRATEAEAVALNESGVRCELIDGRIVRKTMGAPESFIGVQLAYFISAYLVNNRIGFLYGADALVRFAPELLLEPDLAFTSRSRCPGGKLPREQVASVIPNLVVEVLSPSNRPGEMARKLDAYFAAGVELVWVIDPATRSARIHTSPDAVSRLGPADSLDGGAVLPGFALSLAKLFEEFD